MERGLPGHLLPRHMEETGKTRSEPTFSLRDSQRLWVGSAPPRPQDRAPRVCPEGAAGFLPLPWGPGPGRPEPTWFSKSRACLFPSTDWPPTSPEPVALFWVAQGPLCKGRKGWVSGGPAHTQGASTPPVTRCKGAAAEGASARVSWFQQTIDYLQKVRRQGASSPRRVSFWGERRKLFFRGWGRGRGALSTSHPVCSPALGCTCPRPVAQTSQAQKHSGKPHPHGVLISERAEGARRPLPRALSMTQPASFLLQNREREWLTSEWGFGPCNVITDIGSLRDIRSTPPCLRVEGSLRSHLPSEGREHGRHELQGAGPWASESAEPPGPVLEEPHTAARWGHGFGETTGLRHWGPGNTGEPRSHPAWGCRANTRPTASVGGPPSGLRAL